MIRATLHHQLQPLNLAYTVCAVQKHAMHAEGMIDGGGVVSILVLVVRWQEYGMWYFRPLFNCSIDHHYCTAV